MSKPRRKIRSPRRHARQQPKAKTARFKIPRSALVAVVVVVLAGVPFALGKYFEFSSPCAFDGGAYVYSAAHILAGAEIGVEEKPSAQLGTLLLNILAVRMFGFNDFGPKVVQMLLQAGALVLMFIALKRLFGTLAASVGVIVASVYLSAPLIAKYGNVKEQFMIAFMVGGASCFVLYELKGRWPLAVLAGALAGWAPLFKPTGTSVVGAIGLFVLAQPILKHKSLKQTGRDILLLLAGLIAAMAPLYVWILAWDVQLPLPYAFVWQTLARFVPSGSETVQAASDYIGGSRKLVPFSEQWPRVLRYYALLILPIALAAGAIIARLVRAIRRAVSSKKAEARSYDRFMLLFALWWVLDMAFVWISPRSYEQYYLPLNASAAMLGGYLVALYHDKIKAAGFQPKLLAVGALGLLAMIVMSWHIFFGIQKSPHSGVVYRDSAGNPTRRRGYLQKYREVAQRRRYNLKGPWEQVGEYIRSHSAPTDKIYVWGWYPGIYVKAQRFSSASRAFSMPRPAPPVMGQLVKQLIEEFRQEMPKFIVDTRKRHIPVERPPYELWPIVIPPVLGVSKPRFLRTDPAEIETYNKEWREVLAGFDEDEALRYDKLKPLRELVMNEYVIVRMFGPHVLFKLKQSTTTQEP